MSEYSVNWENLYWLIIFMINSFMTRPCDKWKNCRHFSLPVQDVVGVFSIIILWCESCNARVLIGVCRVSGTRIVGAPGGETLPILLAGVEFVCRMSRGRVWRGPDVSVTVSLVKRFPFRVSYGRSYIGRVVGRQRCWRGRSLRQAVLMSRWKWWIFRLFWKMMVVFCPVFRLSILIVFIVRFIILTSLGESTVLRSSWSLRWPWPLRRPGMRPWPLMWPWPWRWPLSVPVISRSAYWGRMMSGD